MGQGFLVVGAFFAAGVFQATTENLRVVVCSGEERVELESLLATGTRAERPQVVEGGIWILDA